MDDPGARPTVASTVSAMYPALRQRLVTTEGIFTTGDASACGYDAPGLARLVSAGEAVRVRRGAYVAAEALTDVTPERRHALRTLAVLRAAGSSATLVPSHHSCLAICDLPLHGVDDEIHFTRTRAGRSAVNSGVHIHRPLSSDAFSSTSPPRLHPAIAIVQTAARHGVEAAVVAGDAALARGLVRRADFDWALERAGLARGAAFARAAVAQVDGRSESPGESRARVLFRALALPEPELQVNIRDGQGLVGRVDFLFRAQRTVVEFDGAVKYDGSSGRQALVREKSREDRLRALGYQVVRLTWADLDAPGRVHELIRRAFARSSSGQPV